MPQTHRVFSLWGQTPEAETGQNSSQHRGICGLRRRLKAHMFERQHADHFLHTFLPKLLLPPWPLSQVWINQGDIILLSLRDFQDDKADVIQKYTADEARNLKAYGELPETAKINETDTFGPDDDGEIVEFDEDDIECVKPLQGNCLGFLGRYVHA